MASPFLHFLHILMIEDMREIMCYYLDFVLLARRWLVPGWSVKQATEEFKNDTDGFLFVASLA